MTYLLALIRAIHFGAVLWLFGEFVFFAVVEGPAAHAAADALRPGSSMRRLTPMAAYGLAAALVSALAWLAFEASNMSGTPLPVAVNPRTLGTVISDTLFGRIWVCRLAVALLLIVTLWLARRREPAGSVVLLRVGGTFLAGTYAATLAWTGHAAADIGSERYIHLGSDAVHLLAAGAWVGALPALIAVLKRGGDAAPPGRGVLAVRAARRFSTLGMAVVSGLLVTGLVNASYTVGSIPALWGTPYGRLLLCKLGLFAVMIVLAAINRLRLTPRLAAMGGGVVNDRASLDWLRRNASLELAGGIAIVCIVAALGLTMPASHMLHHEDMAPMSSEAHH